MNEIAKRLNFKVEYQNTSWDAMIQAVSAVVHADMRPEEAFELLQDLTHQQAAVTTAS